MLAHALTRIAFAVAAFVGYQPFAVAQIVDGRTVRMVHYAGGRYQQDGPKQWREFANDNRRYTYTEVARDQQSLVLHDRGRNVDLRFDLAKNTILLKRIDQPAKGYAPLFAITRQSNAASETEQKCYDAVQRRVAWNRQGDKVWSSESLRGLCETTTLVEHTVACFNGEIRSHGDYRRAIKACTEGRHEVVVLYLVPSDRQPRPNIESALAAIMTVVQRHYIEQLGVTFKLKSPLVHVVHIGESNEVFKKSGAMLDRCNRLAKQEFRADYWYRENAVLCFVDTDARAAAGASGNNIGLPAWAWSAAYDAFQKGPTADLASALGVAASHETGHSFGLLHTSDSKRCFAGHGVDLGELPDLIMEHKAGARNPNLYAVPFHAEEKRLLLDTDYFPDCRPLAGGRPHASWFLRHKLPLPAVEPAAGVIKAASNLAPIKSK